MYWLYPHERDHLAGQDTHCYYYLVCAVRIGGESNCSENQAGKFTRPLSSGPNLVSIPLIQSNESIETVLQTVKFNKAWTHYSNITDPWKWHMPSKPYKGGLRSVNHILGLWTNVTRPSNLTVAGIVPLQTKIQLFAGWSLVSYPSFNAIYTVLDLKAEVGATRVEGYDHSLPPYYLRVLGDTEVLRAGYGYWVRVEASTVWIVEVA